MKPTLQQLTAALHASWDSETGYANGISWSPENPARGQCVVSSLIVQDYFGGDLVRFAVTGDGLQETHYCNLLEDGTLLDTTASQYKEAVSMKRKDSNVGTYTSLREKRLDDVDTSTRYVRLKAKVEAYLADHK
jgi:hypothetical protein